MEKMRSLDGKLKHQIDRLMKLSLQPSSETGSSSLRPNPMALMSKGGGEEEESDEEERSSGSVGKLSKTTEGGEFYRAPKMAAAPYKVTSFFHHTTTINLLLKGRFRFIYLGEMGSSRREETMTDR